MKKRIWSILVLIVITACSVTPPAGEITMTPTSSLPTPVVNITSAPDAAQAAVAFLDAWVAEDYPAMYTML
ncbi:MAG TPA: hypothetical protein PLY85_10030 [Anaerolineaceae bacterium]|nr:hypothetical protein [Anaerolineaceae bacterium]